MLATCGLAIAASTTTNLHLAKTSFGQYVAVRLQNGHRYPIYISTHDRRDRSRCFGTCVQTFQPVLVRGKVKAWNGVRQKLVGSIDRGHGVKQVTYNDHPLYTSSSDVPGTSVEDGVCAYSGHWYVVGRNGNPDKRLTYPCGYY